MMTSTKREQRSARAGETRSCSRLRLLLLVLLTLVWCGHAHADDWSLVEEQWYVMKMNGVRNGWTHSAVHERGDLFRTTTHIHMTVGRADAQLTIEIQTTFIETREGKPKAMSARQVMSQQPVETEWTFEDDKVIWRSGDALREGPLPEGVWLTPRAVHRFLRERLAAGATDMAYRTIDPQAGLLPMTFRCVRIGEAEFDAGGRAIPVSVWRVTNDKVPPSVEHYSRDGYLVYQETMVGQGVISLHSAPGGREEAMRDLAVPAPEVMLQTFVKPDRPIKDVASKRKLVLRLSAIEGELPSLPSAGAQRVEMAADSRSAMIRVNVNDPLPATEADIAEQAYREASPLIDFGDEVVQQLADRAAQQAGNPRDARTLADAMRTFVDRHIVFKGMETAFASASETARHRTGDCSEHAVLLAAVLRAKGIPSRIATGLVYVDEFAGEKDIFGWHMWTQALIDGKWIDFDAAMPGPYHAGHILISVSGFSEGLSPVEMTPTVLLMGNLKIEVIE
ncbi:MAG TPA: transglutaminase-like domain-containing protein [Phycisphaerales bacterium]|nr:transglutaminase-like domain-containing protein [Phycisphaerales bacterium]HRQ75905.1 transglutaminase-like domain-containing protein [Phycisphaerales bacterium]